MEYHHTNVSPIMISIISLTDKLREWFFAGEGNATLIKAFLQLAKEGQDRLHKQEKCGLKSEYKKAKDELHQKMKEVADVYFSNVGNPSYSREDLEQQKHETDRKLIERYVQKCVDIAQNGGSRGNETESFKKIQPDNKRISESCIIRISSTLHFFWCKTEGNAECGMALKSQKPFAEHAAVSRREFLDVGNCKDFLEHGMDCLMDRYAWMREMNEYVPLSTKEYLNSRFDKSQPISKHSVDKYQDWRNTRESYHLNTAITQREYIMGTQYVERVMEFGDGENNGDDGDDDGDNSSVPMKKPLTPEQYSHVSRYTELLNAYETVRVIFTATQKQLDISRAELDELNRKEKKLLYNQRMQKNKEVEDLKNNLFFFRMELTRLTQELQAMKNVIDLRKQEKIPYAEENAQAQEEEMEEMDDRIF